MKNFLSLLLLMMVTLNASSQNKPQKLMRYKASLQRADGQMIVFNFDLDKASAIKTLYIINGKERIKVDSVRFTGDSVFIKMPLFESAFKAKITNDNWQGVWLKETSKGTQQMPFKAYPSKDRFFLTKGPSTVNIKGRWQANFASDSGKNINAVAEFYQTGNLLTGSFLTTTGDYRYLEGVITGNKLYLSTFDGSHAFLFTADITSGNTIQNGIFYSGPQFKDAWTAVKNALAKVPEDASAMYVKRGESKLDFRFPDLDSNLVSINDSRFKNKVVVIQILGSWCPNCMDETAFLSEYYKQNKQRGVEVLGLAYEYGTDFAKGKQGLLKFKQRFNVQYPLLFTGVSVTDTLRTEKTLPQVTPIKVFPSSIVLDKKGNIRKLDNGFYGPGTGEHYTEYKAAFNKTIDALLKE